LLISEFISLPLIRIQRASYIVSLSLLINSSFTGFDHFGKFLELGIHLSPDSSSLRLHFIHIVLDSGFSGITILIIRLYDHSSKFFYLLLEGTSLNLVGISLNLIDISKLTNLLLEVSLDVVSPLAYGIFGGFD